MYALYDKLLDSSALNVHDIFQNYDNLYKSFKTDYHWTLRMSVQIYLACHILHVWNALDRHGLTVTTLDFIQALLVFTLYFHGASVLENIFTKFETQLWQKGKKYLQNTTKSDKHFYNYTLQYIQKYPIYVQIGSVVVSKTNAITFVIGIIVTRALSYGFTKWIDEHY